MIVTNGLLIVSAVAIQVWEFGDSFFDEVEYLWRYVEMGAILGIEVERSDIYRF